MFRLWSEWDLGYGDTIFTSVERALEVLKEDENVKHIIETHDNLNSVGDIIGEGLMGFHPLRVVE